MNGFEEGMGGTGSVLFWGVSSPASIDMCVLEGLQGSVLGFMGYVGRVSVMDEA